jgi:NAD-dependent SIR2 family protein deacetylase
MTEKDCCGHGKGGNCVCPKCETTIPHRKGVRCQDERCPECNAKMLREGSEHHRLWLEKKARKST